MLGILGQFVCLFVHHQCNHFIFLTDRPLDFSSLTNSFLSSSIFFIFFWFCRWCWIFNFSGFFGFGFSFGFWFGFSLGYRFSGFFFLSFFLRSFCCWFFNFYF